MASMSEILAVLNADYDSVIQSLNEVATTTRADYFWHFRPFDVPSHIPKIHSNFSKGFVNSYIEQKYQKTDPVVIDSLSSNILLWWENDDQACRDPVGDEVMRERFAQGCSIGVSLPVRGKAGQFSIFSLWSSDREAFRRAVADCFSNLHTYALYLHDALYRHCRSQDAHSLTNIELELLRWTALGKTAWEISVLVSLPERTVHYHLAEASRKLYAPNKTAAVCTALKAGLLDM